MTLKRMNACHCLLASSLLMPAMCLRCMITCVGCAPQTGWTALMCASRWGHEVVARVLVEAGADVNAADGVSVVQGGVWLRGASLPLPLFLPFSFRRGLLCPLLPSLSFLPHLSILSCIVSLRVCVVMQSACGSGCMCAVLMCVFAFCAVCVSVWEEGRIYTHTHQCVVKRARA